MNKEFIKKLGDSTIIEAGHYSYKKGPSKLDIFLWELGVELYSYAKNKYKKIGLMVLVDDVHQVQSNEERKSFNIKKLPEAYLEILKEKNINGKKVLIYSQEKLKEKGRKLLKKKDGSRTSAPKCRLIVATLLKEKERLGYKRTLVLSDELKTEKGRKMVNGTIFSRFLYDTKIIVHQFIFKSKKEYEYYFMGPDEGSLDFEKAKEIC